MPGVTHWLNATTLTKLISKLIPTQTQFHHLFNTFRPRQNCRHFEDDIFKCFFLNENVWIWLKISLKFVPNVRINNTPALVQIMAWRLPGDKPLSELMMVSLLTHICGTRPQWVNAIWHHPILSINPICLHCYVFHISVELSWYQCFSNYNKLRYTYISSLA